MDVESAFLLHSNSQNVQLVSLCDSFESLTSLTTFGFFQPINQIIWPIRKRIGLTNLSVFYENVEHDDTLARFEKKVCFGN